MLRVKSIFAAVLMLAMALMTSSVARAQGNSEAAKLRQLNNSLLTLHGQLIAANASQGASLRSQASAVIAERFAALQTMIQNDPMLALQFGFDADLLASMKESFPASAAQFEEQGKWSGPVDYLIFDDHTLMGHKVEVTMASSDGSLKLHFKDKEPTWFKCSDILTVSGMKAGAQVAAADGSVSGSVAGATCSTQGVQRTLVILFNTTDDPATTTVNEASTLPAGATKAMLEKIYNTGDGTTNPRSLNGYWQEASHGRASVSAHVTDILSIVGIDCGQYYTIRDRAIAAANAADPTLDLTQFTRIALIFPGAGCGWAGLGNLGCGSISTPDGIINASTVWNIASYMTSINQGVQLAAHEGGHNLTLHHAATRYFTNATTGAAEPIGPLGTAGTHSEYGDRHSAMGSWNLGHYAAPHKQQIGWFAGSNVQTVESNGSFSIQPFENVTTGPQALKVRRGTGNNAWFWLEFRQGIGLYDSTLGSQVRNGALIHHSDASTGTFTHLLDFTPETPNNFSDAARLPGTGLWTDPYTNLSFSVDSISGTLPNTALNVTVNYGPVPCANSNPTVSLSPSSQSGMAGNTLNYNVSVTNNDSTGCTASTFILTSVVPSGWSGTFTNAAPSIAPGASFSTTLQVGIAGSAAPGSNSISATATRGANSGSGFGTANVVVAPITTMNPITPNTYAPRATVSMSAVSTVAGSPAGGASVTFTMTKPNGATTTKTVVAGANGVATWSYRLGPKDPTGTYSVKAKSTANGVLGVDGTPVTFLVQ